MIVRGLIRYVSSFVAILDAGFVAERKVIDEQGKNDPRTLWWMQSLATMSIDQTVKLICVAWQGCGAQSQPIPKWCPTPAPTGSG